MEVDTNYQIIQLVRSRPVLYSKCSDFRARTHQWKEIADILKVDVSWVKSRWHLLRAKFLVEYSSELKGKRTTFKYFNDLSFLDKHVNVNAFEMHLKESEVIAPPEFIISNKDLEDGSDDDSSNIFIELELDDGTNKELVQMQETLDLTGEHVSENELEETMYLPSDDTPQHEQLASKIAKYDVDSQVEMFQIVDVQEKEDSATVVIQEDDKSNLKQSNANKPYASEMETSSNAEKGQQLCQEVPNPTSEDRCSAKSEKYRCEDSIFGELVTATLRKMPNEKKKAVKREIMNILFT